MLLLPLDLDSERWRSFSGTVEDVIDLPILRDAAKDFACCPIQEVAVDTDVRRFRVLGLPFSRTNEL